MCFSDRPAQSPDLNPIENLWHTIEATLRLSHHSSRGFYNQDLTILHSIMCQRFSIELRSRPCVGRLEKRIGAASHYGDVRVREIRGEKAPPPALFLCSFCGVARRIVLNNHWWFSMWFLSLMAKNPLAYLVGQLLHTYQQSWGLPHEGGGPALNGRCS